MSVGSPEVPYHHIRIANHLNVAEYNLSMQQAVNALDFTINGYQT
jgi:hypothetical protein